MAQEYTQAQADLDIALYAKRLNYYMDNFLPKVFAAKIATFIDAMTAPQSVDACKTSILHYLHTQQTVWDNFDFYAVKKYLFARVDAVTWTPV